MATWVDKVRLQFEDGGSAQYVAAGKKVAGTTSEMEKAFGGLKAAAAALTTIWGSNKIVGFIRGATAAAADAEQVNVKLAAVLQATGKSAEMSVGFINDLADALSRETTFSAGTIKDAEALLLTFDNISKETLPRMTRAMLDMAVVMGKDTREAAMALGLALSNPEEGLLRLSRMGVRFNDAEKATIKSMVDAGRSADAQAFVLAKLESRFKGVAVAAGATASGNLEQFDNKIGQIKKTIGAPFLAVMGDAAEAMTGFLDAAKESGDVSRIALNAAEVISGLGAITADFVKMLAWAFDDLQLVWKSARAVIDVIPNLLIALKGGAGLEQIKADFAGIGAQLDETKASLDAWAGAGSSQAKMEVFWENYRKQLKAAKEDQDKLTGEKPAGGGSAPAVDEKALKERADREAAALQALNQIRDDNLQATHEGRLQIIENQYATERAMAAEFGFDLQEIADKRDRLVLDEETKNAEAEIALAEKTYDEKKALADKEKEIANARAGYVLDVAQTYGEALKMVVGSNKKGAAALKAIGMFEAGVNGARAVLQAMTLPPPVAAFAVPAAILAAGVQTAKIATARFAAGGFPSGRGSMIQVNEMGQESVLNSRATSRLGVAGVTALNSGAPYPGRTTNEISYAPVYNFAGGAAPDILAALENDKNRFASFLNRLQKRGYFATAGAL